MEWKDAIVFISSTFNDMHAERDYLIKEVFPELTEWCEERHIRLTDIDLRWGVTEEESRSKKTIETCLRHIDKSRPFFLCFLGQRRGWLPDFKEDITDLTRNTYKSIDDLDGRSATEMEIEHALLKPIHMFLNDEEFEYPPTRHSIFFFRDDEYLKDITDYQRLIYTNESEAKFINPSSGIIQDNDDEDKIKLADEELAKTKEKIRNRKVEEDAKSDDDETKVNVLITDYKGHWNKNLILPELNPVETKNGPCYTHGENKGRLTDFECDGKSLKSVIIKQLKEQIGLAFPDNKPGIDETELERDINQQEIFCFLNSEGFIKRPEYTKQLEDYVSGSYDRKLCLVTANAGYGKTMLLAKFATDFYGNFPDRRLYKRFCGASDLSSDIYSLWKSIIDEAKISPDEEFYPKNLDELKRNVTDILEAIGQKGESVIIIDAVNQMNDGINMLKWIGEIPDNVKLIASIKEDKSNERFDSILSQIKKRENVSGFEIMELDDEGKKDLIDEYLKSYLKGLDSEQIDIICGFEGSKNPLFLKILLAELRVFGSFGQLKEKIKLFGDSPVSAFKHVLDRLEEDEEYVEGENIVPLLFSLLANARAGLSENEILGIIQSQTNLSQKEILDAVRLNLRQVRPFMARKEGRHDFFYESFEIAASEKYAQNRIESNRLIADYFMKRADPCGDYSFNVFDDEDAKPLDELSQTEISQKLRPLNELPYHINQSGDNEGLSKVLSSYSFIKNKLDLSDIYNVVLDYQFSQDHEFNREEDHPIVLIGRALELSAPILEDNKDQFDAQLWGRMNEIEDDTIKSLLDELDSKSDGNWLKSKKTALYSPKSSIIKRIKPEGKKSSNAISILDEMKIILANEDGMVNIFDMNVNDLDTFDEGDSKIIKIILNDGDNSMIAAYSNGEIREWDIDNRIVSKEYPKIDAEITDIYLSKTYKKIYASSHNGIFTIDLDTNELRKEDIEEKNYNQILVPRRNEAILVCDEKEVDGWDVYEMRKAYNRQHQQNPDGDESGTQLDSSEEIRFMGLNKRFLTLISENGQMKFWNTLKNSGGGESIDEARVCSPHDKFAKAITLDDEDQIITISDMGVLYVWDIPRPRQPKFEIAKINGTDIPIDIQTGIKSPTAIDYFTDGEDRWVIVGNENNDISVIDLNKKVEANKEIKHRESVLSIKIDECHMITASDNGEIFTWDLDSEECINQFANDFRVNAISYNYDNSKLAMAGVKTEKDGRKTYKVATCNADKMWSPVEREGDKPLDLDVDDTINSEAVIDIAQTSEGIVFLEEKTLNINGNQTALDKVATTLATEFNSNNAFVGFEDGSIVEYPSNTSFDTKSGSSVAKIKVGEDKLVAGFEDGSIEIFDLSGTNLASFKAHEKSITNLYLDDSRLISLSEDNTIRFWQNDECVYTYFLDIFATSINIKDDKLIVGDTLGNLRFFNFK